MTHFLPIGIEGIVRTTRRQIDLVDTCTSLQHVEVVLVEFLYALLVYYKILHPIVFTPSNKPIYLPQGLGAMLTFVSLQFLYILFSGDLKLEGICMGSFFSSKMNCLRSKDKSIFLIVPYSVYDCQQSYDAASSPVLFMLN